MNLIHLTSQQTKRRNFDHPLLDNSMDLDAAALNGLVEFYISTGSKQAYDDLILGNLILVKWVVGRYLHHWPESRPFEDDMASEGFMAVATVIKELSEQIDAGQLRAMIVHRIKHNIEEFLNNNRSMVRASARTNRRRLAAGQELEYVSTVSLDEQQVHGQLDENFTAIDILDSLDALGSVDKEEFIDVVLLMLERYPQILESEVPERLKILIENIVQAVKGSQ